MTFDIKVCFHGGFLLSDPPTHLVEGKHRAKRASRKLMISKYFTKVILSLHHNRRVRGTPDHGAQILVELIPCSIDGIRR